MPSLPEYDSLVQRGIGRGSSSRRSWQPSGRLSQVKPAAVLASATKIQILSRCQTERSRANPNRSSPARATYPKQEGNPTCQKPASRPPCRYPFLQPPIASRHVILFPPSSLHVATHPPDLNGSRQIPRSPSNCPSSKRLEKSDVIAPANISGRLTLALSLCPPSFLLHPFRLSSPLLPIPHGFRHNAVKMPPNPIEDDEDEEESEPESSENEEIQSHPNGRLMAPSQPVTVAAAAVPYHHPHPHQNLTLALPIQNPSRPPTAATGGREDCWSEGATGVLIDAWGERYLELSRGNLKQKHWKDVADIVSSRDDYTKPPKTDVQCKNRIDTVKKKYKIEKAKISGGGGPSKWVFFSKLDRLIGGGPQRKPNPPPAPAPAAQTIPISPQKASVIVPAQPRPRAPQPASSNSGGDDSSDSFPPPVAANGKRKRAVERESAKARARNSIRELTRAVVEFGEVYERVERSKLQQVMELEQQRMVFAKELELQRMQFFMKTQLELAQMKHGRTGRAWKEEVAKAAAQ
ncbi:hypothetical protein ACLOJK_033350 [Asimina triloba]